MKIFRFATYFHWLTSRNKGSDKSIVAAARKMAEITWALLTAKQDFDSEKMRGRYKPISLIEEVLSAMN